MDDPTVAGNAGLTMRVVARPTSPFRFRFALAVDGEPAGELTHVLWGRPGRLRVGEHDYTIERAGSRRWRLSGGPAQVSAEPTGPLRYSYRLDWAGGSLVAARRGLGYGMRFFEAGEEVGRMGLRNLFTRTLVADIPDHVPVEVMGLAMYLAIRMRRRAIAASGGA